MEKNPQVKNIFEQQSKKKEVHGVFKKLVYKR
jgi:hypothetical protein